MKFQKTALGCATHPLRTAPIVLASFLVVPVRVGVQVIKAVREIMDHPNDVAIRDKWLAHPRLGQFIKTVIRERMQQQFDRSPADGPQDTI